jgi:tetratricopeptide (TPR) repeat protein
MSRPSSTPTSHQIFVSYSRSDRVAVDRLVNDLRDRHFNLWIDVSVQGIEPGEDWQAELIKQMSDSAAVIACLSPDFLESRYCKAEIEQAQRENKPIYPVLVGRLRPDQSPAQMKLDHIQFVDLDRDYAEGLKRLTRVLPHPPLTMGALIERSKLALAAFAVVVGILIIVVIGAALAPMITTPTPTPLPPTPTPFIREDIGVAVAYFTLPESDTALSESAQSLVNSFSEQLQQQIDTLNNRLKLGSSIGFLSPEHIGIVEGQDEDARGRIADQLAADHNADIIVYGTITQTEDGLLQIQPAFRVLSAAFGNAQELGGGSRFGKAIAISNLETQEARNQLTARARALALVVEGLTQFVDQDYAGALATFEQTRALPDWENMVGREVLNILIGNAHLRLASRATIDCDRDGALAQANAAIEEYQQADNITERNYARPFSGLASATYIVARWTPAESADNDCQSVFDLNALEQAQTYIDQAKEQDDLSSHPIAQGYLFLNEARIFYAYCISLAEIDERYADYYARFEGATSALVDLYTERRVSALAPLVSTAYFWHGDIAYWNTQYREAITFFQQALDTDQSDLDQSVEAYRWLGESYYAIGQLADSARAFDRASVLASQIPDPDLAAIYADARHAVDSELQATDRP